MPSARWFREAKFGIFVHWDVYSLIGCHISAQHDSLTVISENIPVQLC